LYYLGQTYEQSFLETNKLDLGSASPPQL
jgi:hypothetical protein